MQRVLSGFRRGIDLYNLIEEGDKIAVGISGGKDSLVLAKALALYRKFAPYKFEVVGITIDMFNNNEFDEIKAFCKEIDIEYYVVPSDIYKIVFEERKEKNPCSLCSKLRKGMLNSKALELNCNKLALGHSADDLIHTFLLSLFYEGRLSTLSPKIYLDRTGITIIRPLILVDERDIKSVAKSLPVLQSKCPVNKLTKREYTKDVIKYIEQTIPFVKERIFGAITNPYRYNLFDKLETNNQSKTLKNQEKISSNKLKKN